MEPLHAQDPDAVAPHARGAPPWSDCGRPASADFGLIFARPARNGGWVLTYDRAGEKFAATILRREPPGPELELHGRRFTIVTLRASARVR